MSEKELHDLLLEKKPEGAKHDEDKCPICLAGEISQEEKVAEITQEQHEALLEAAVEKAKSELSSDHDAEVLSLNEQLSTAQSEIESLNARISEFETQEAERDEQARLEALADERAELVRAAEVNFSDEQIEARKLQWAKKDEEEFAALLEDYKEVAKAAAPESPGGGAPKSKVLTGTRETAGDDTTPNALEAFFGASVSAADAAL
jgi:TolA-binding protein